jgi:virulence-associated protein VagC
MLKIGVGNYEVKEVHIRRQRDARLISIVKSNWATFFALPIGVPEDFLERRDDAPPQSREERYVCAVETEDPPTIE